MKLQKKGSIKRDSFSCIVVEFNFRGIPQKTSAYQQHYVFGGRTDIVFTGYSLNSEELKKVNDELSKSDIGDALKLIEGTTGSIEDLQEDIDLFLKEEDKAEKKAERTKNAQIHFLLFLEFITEKKESHL